MCWRWACFPGLVMRGCGGKLTGGLGALGLGCPSEKALRDLRRRLGPAPLKALSGGGRRALA